jgi:hypothetical protein
MSPYVVASLIEPGALAGYINIPVYLRTSIAYSDDKNNIENKTRIC